MILPTNEALESLHGRLRDLESTPRYNDQQPLLLICRILLWIGGFLWTFTQGRKK